MNYQLIDLDNCSNEILNVPACLSKIANEYSDEELKSFQELFLIIVN